MIVFVGLIFQTMLQEFLTNVKPLRGSGTSRKHMLFLLHVPFLLDSCFPGIETNRVNSGFVFRSGCTDHVEHFNFKEVSRTCGCSSIRGTGPSQ